MTPPLLEDYPDFAKTDEEAARRFTLTKSIDPFPEIQPSLLNSADIHDYVRVTGMLHPFDPDHKTLKSAAYLAPIGGRCIWWDDSGKLHDIRLRKGQDEELILGPNSITFVQIEPFFRLPDYIALRFNLKITHVHRGILLGTGPLVDPGFVGKLLIPIHNLTPNTYRLGCGEGLIWIEFTKTSEIPVRAFTEQNSLGVSRRGKYVEFPQSKNEIQPLDYLRKASPQAPVMSSIPEAVLKSKNEATSARRWVQGLTGLGVVGLFALGFSTWQLIQETWKVVDEVRAKSTLDIAQEKERMSKFDELQKHLQLVDKQLEDKVSALKKQIDQVRARQPK
ncbi:MAG: hypothetical protein K0S45_4621 [Nitrospira sp.]|nr:hypothetical protein [Nitrospira sp.]